MNSIVSQHPFISIAARNVSRNRRRSLITMASIAFGIAAVLVMQAYAQGFLDMVVDGVVNARSGAIQIHKEGYLKNSVSNPVEYAFTIDEPTLAALKKLPGVKAVTKRIRFTGMITNGVYQSMFVGRGLDLGTESLVCPKASEDLESGGEPLKLGDFAHAIVGNELAQSLKAKPATASGSEAGTQDTLTLSSASPEGRQNSMDIRVKGLMRSIMGFESKRVLTVPLDFAQSLLNLKGGITEVAVAVDSLDQLESVRQSIAQLLGASYEVHDWQAANPFVRDVLARQKFILVIVSAILFVIVVFGVTNTMLMSVFERVREIGTMMSVGVKRPQIVSIFLFEGLLLAFLGCALGLIIGWSVLKLLVAMGLVLPGIGTTAETKFYPTIGLAFALKTVILTAIGATLSSLYPAFKASRLDPIEALRST